jgi:hypothetical protein
MCLYLNLILIVPKAPQSTSSEIIYYRSFAKNQVINPPVHFAIPSGKGGGQSAGYWRVDNAPASATHSSTELKIGWSDSNYFSG